jgi:hypothetical protein
MPARGQVDGRMTANEAERALILAVILAIVLAVMTRLV